MMEAREIGQNLVEPMVDDRQCWICLSQGGEEMIAPCHCAGDLKWVHRPCLNRWRVDATNHRNFTNCRHCGLAFHLVLDRSPTENEEQLTQRKRRFLFRTVSNMLLIAVLVQVLLIGLAMGIRALDPKEELVKFFDFPQIEGTPPAGVGDFWNAIRSHKSTYFLAAIILALATTGAMGALVALAGLCMACCGRAACNPCPPTSGISPFGGGDPFQTYLQIRCCEECCGDCCFFCGNCGDGGCVCDEACSNTCKCADCDICKGSCECPSGGGSEAAGVAAILLLVVVAFFVLIGLVMIFVFLVTWTQRVVTKYFQISEIRHLAGEYVVQDLAGTDYHRLKDQASAPPPPQQGMSFEVPNATAPPAPGMFSPVTDAATSQSLMRDLQAVYGLKGTQMRACDDEGVFVHHASSRRHL